LNKSNFFYLIQLIWIIPKKKNNLHELQKHLDKYTVLLSVLCVNLTFPVRYLKKGWSWLSRENQVKIIQLKSIIIYKQTKTKRIDEYFKIRDVQIIDELLPTIVNFSQQYSWLGKIYKLAKYKTWKNSTLIKIGI